jgi:hypothetical protein
MVYGRGSEVIIVPNPTYLPFWTALTIAGFVLSFLFSFYGLATFCCQGARLVPPLDP